MCGNCINKKELENFIKNQVVYILKLRDSLEVNDSENTKLFSYYTGAIFSLKNLSSDLNLELDFDDLEFGSRGEN